MKINKSRFTGACIAIFILLSIVLSFILIPTVTPALTQGGQIIKAIDVKGLSRITSEEFIDMMCFSVGNEFDAEALKKCIRRAFKKGIFLDIQVDTDLSDQGMTLKYSVKEIPHINDIRISGNRYVSKRKIKRVIPFEEGDDFREDLLHEAEKDIADHYIRRGYEDISVNVSVNDVDGPSGVIIDIKINEGEPRVIMKIDMPDDALRRVSIYPGQRFDRDMIDRALDKLKEHYINDGYIKPELGPYELIDGILYIPVDSGVKVDVEFRENTVFSDRKLLNEMPFKDNGMVTDELIEEASGRLRDIYLGKGYYYVQVAAALETSEDNIRVKFIIFEGQKVTLRKIDIKGSSIDPEVIRGILLLHENMAYNDARLERSIDLLENFYNALGYINMKVLDVRKEFEADGAIIDLAFDIYEGDQVKIKGLQITGNRDLSLPEIRNAANLRKNMPFNLIDIGDARFRVLSLYKRYGYVDASIDIRTEIDGAGAIIHFSIYEGSPSVLGKVMIRGDRKTKEKIIRREFTLNEGAPYNYDELLKIKQRIYKLRLFNEVTIEELSSEEQSYKTVRDVIVTVEEDKPGSVEIALGYGEYEEFRGGVDISYRNLGGYDREISLRGELSSVEKRYTLTFIEPWLFNKRDLLFRASLIKEDTEKVNVDTRDVLYKIDKLSAISGIEKELNSNLKVNMNYEYSVTENSDVDPGVILTGYDTDTVTIGSVSASLFYDTRDNPFDPASGSMNGILLKFASAAFLSEVEFIKATLQSSWYYQLRKGLVFATSFKGGASFSYEDEDILPLVERFFLGGRTTVRGYRHDNLGPKGAGDVPTGGNVFALINEELRIYVGKGVGLVLFLDGGNIWQTIGDIDNKFKFTVGTGLRYNTPVGPVRIDYGHKLDRDKGESTGEVHFSFGHAF